ncbi:PepSY domain-containing protein [Desulfosporosinus nitroreducens]|uniref:PepSY domain-containing protein n=1 Tax=Desulfosporosinus nitroreducens TaxID=2018668 RepID=A0ABT8QSL8_9FIRM|nr:PepSY domain-containing protein [Desulfosporosinus nitroreducens]MDO0823489.1 PepSY domain-containing protein [Desulfosporosinus nitroreducens]
MKKTKWIVGLSIVSLVALSGTAFALNSGSVAAKSVGQTLGYVPVVATTQIQETTPQLSTLTLSSTNNNPDSVSTPELDGYSGSYGMMGAQGVNGYGGGYGMMGGQGGYGMMGGQGGYGMMGGGYDAKSLGVDLTNGEVASSDQAVAIAKAYAQKINQDLVISQLHEFSNVYGVEFNEGRTGAKAYEVMVFKNGGRIITDMGPNIMWNTKYGHMNWGNDGAVTVSEEQATNNAQEFVTKMGQGYSIVKPELAPGYYEFMVQKDGKDYVELNVNGYTGQVWLQNWQGPIIQSVDVK